MVRQAVSKVIVTLQCNWSHESNKSDIISSIWLHLSLTGTFLKSSFFLQNYTVNELLPHFKATLLTVTLKSVRTIGQSLKRLYYEIVKCQKSIHIESTNFNDTIPTSVYDHNSLRSFST